MPFHNVFHNPDFWKSFFSGPRYSYDDIPDLSGQVAIVTGATGDLGYATVVALAAHGAHVFLACRNRVKAEEAIERAHADILQLQFDYPNARHSKRFDYDEKSNNNNINHNSGPKLEFLELELGDIRKAHAAAKEFLSRDLPLNILVNNGGIMNKEFDLTEDGYENHFGINHLGHFVFTTTLLERIQESTPARIVVMSSLAHEIPPSHRAIDFKNLRETEKKQPFMAVRYGQSKLANVLFAKALARRLRNHQVWVNIVHPGCIDSQIKKSMLRSDNKAFHNFSRMLLLLAYTAREGALTALYCATSPDIQNMNIRGRYFIPIANELRPNPISDSVDLQEELWAYSEKAVQEVFQG
ncbi:hypothetical protein BGZ76_009104 [Entomortierella beljakovae]|nr:hypothetical protein BGZ76_009104 [Entomortierella beljakovae]